MFKKVSLIFIILLFLITPLSAGNWDSFQMNVQHHGYLKDDSDYVTNLWIQDVGKNPSSSAVYKDLIYVVSHDGVLKAIDMQTGEVEWDLEIGSDTNSTPIIHNNRLYVGCEDGLKAININNHEVVWDYDCGSVDSAPYYYEDTIYFGSSDGHLYGVDSDGKLDFSKKLDGEIKSPIVVDDTIYVASTNSKLYSIDLDKNINWRFTTGDEILSTPSYVNETVIFGSNDGNLYCLNQSGGDLIWKVDLNNKVISSPVVDEHDNNVFIGSDEGNLTCIDTRDGTVKWSHSTGGRIETTSALKDNLIAYGTTDGYLYVLNKYTGIEEFSYNPGTLLFNSPITSSPVIYGNSLFFSDASGQMYSLNIDKYEVPGSIQLFLSLAVLIILIVVVVAAARFIKGRR